MVSLNNQVLTGSITSYNVSNNTKFKVGSNITITQNDDGTIVIGLPEQKEGQISQYFNLSDPWPNLDIIVEKLIS